MRITHLLPAPRGSARVPSRAGDHIWTLVPGVAWISCANPAAGPGSWHREIPSFWGAARVQDPDGTWTMPMADDGSERRWDRLMPGFSGREVLGFSREPLTNEIRVISKTWGKL
jgi:hypothetical protein